MAWYEEQFRLQQHKQFGASSERFEGQEQLFNEAEELALCSMR
ncbi:transposase [Endozoicomonas gorgoniicola]